MAAQQHAQPQDDDLLEHLDEINKEIADKEIKLEQTEIHPQKPKKTEPIGKKIVTYAIFASVGICLGLGVRALFQAPVDTNQTITIQQQTTISEQRETEILDQSLTQSYFIDGGEYSVYSTLSDFEKNGWVIDTTDSTPTSTLAVDQTVEMSLMKGDLKLDTFAVINNTEESIPLEQGTIDHIYIFDENAKPVGIYGVTPDMSVDEIVKIFKDNNLPYEIRKNGTYTYYEFYVYGAYSNGQHGSVSIEFGTEGNKVNSMYFTQYIGSDNLFVSLPKAYEMTELNPCVMISSSNNS